MFYFSKRSLPCSLHLRLSTPQFSIRITSTVLSGSIPDFSPIHNCYLIVLQSIALASTLYHNYIANFCSCKIATWYFFSDFGLFCTMRWYFYYFTVMVIVLYTPFCAYTQILQVPFPTALIFPLSVTMATLRLLLS